MAIRSSGKHGRRKVSVPNVVGAARSSAQSAITSAQLTYTESSTDTSNSGLSQIVQSQGVSSGSVVLIGSNIPFTYYNYVAPPPPIIATPPPIIATPPPIIATPPPIIATPPPIIAVPSPTIDSITEVRGCTSIGINWSGSNAQSWAVTNGTGWTPTQSGNGGNSGSWSAPLGCSTTQTSTLRLYSGLNQTGTTVSQAFTVSTLSCTTCNPPPPPIIATPPPIIATPPPIIATPPPIIATPPPIIATPPPIIATGPDCSTASCGNDPGRACCFYLRGVCRAC